VADPLEDLQLAGAAVQIALDRVPRHRLTKQTLDFVPDLANAEVAFGLPQDLDDGAAHTAELAPVVGCWPFVLRLGFGLFTPWLTCETLE
jgi:hypothetical protein